MRAHDGQFREFLVQVLDIRESRKFDVENHCLRTFASHIVPQFFAGAG